MYFHLINDIGLFRKWRSMDFITNYLMYKLFEEFLQKHQQEQAKKRDD